MASGQEEYEAQLEEEANLSQQAEDEMQKTHDFFEKFKCSTCDKYELEDNFTDDFDEELLCDC